MVGLKLLIVFGALLVAVLLVCDVFVLREGEKLLSVLIILLVVAIEVLII